MRGNERCRVGRMAAGCCVLVGTSLFGCARGVRPDQYLSHVRVLASDSLTGRGVGTPGIDMAAGYIAGQFASLGIEPGGEAGSYFQPFEMATGSEMMDDYAFSFSGVDVVPARGEDFVPFGFSSNDTFEGDVAFVGYGIVNEEKDHNDYRDIDVKGKVVLMLRREPPGWGEGRPTRHAMFRSKIYAAKDAGAVAVLIVNRVKDDVEDRLVPFGRGGGGEFGMPAFHVKQALAEKLLSAGGLGTLAALQERLDGGAYASAPLAGVRLRGRAGVEAKKALVRNVIGLIRGEGPLKDEYVVIGGHYDHLGNSVPMMRRFGRGARSSDPEIHNGADDNASGTAGVIEAGRLLVASKPLKRSVLLMAFTGEESGLVGSKYFVEHPIVPLENIVTMLNMDMIGRMDEKSTVQVFGTAAADGFDEMIKRLGRRAGLTIRGNESAIGPSDHTSFYQKKIPSLHFFTGLHEDYHRPGDDTEKVNAEGGARVTDMVVAVAREIIGAAHRPTYHKVTTRARIGRASAMARRSGDEAESSRPRVVMGVMPSYVDEGQTQGMTIDGVTPEGPAAQAGLKEGDRIVKIGDSKISGIYDYMGALRNAKPGDVVDVVVSRESGEVTLKVKLAGR